MVEKEPRVSSLLKVQLILPNAFSTDHTLKYFLIFPKEKTGFDISCKLSPLLNPVFWGKIRNNSYLSSAELAERVIKVKGKLLIVDFNTINPTT